VLNARFNQVFGVKNIIATASRPETIDWVKQHGATHVINHREDLGERISLSFSFSHKTW
jgi:NADPH:quinone reductase-like Zn-dependent oxidoreductase